MPNTATNHLSQLPKVGPARRKLIGNHNGLTQAYEFRDLAADEAMALRDMPLTELEDRLARAKALQALNMIWRDSTDRIRILRGKPLPGSLRPERKPARKKQVSLAPTEEPINPAQSRNSGTSDGTSI